jgi:peptidoglycan/xylan/chitin deacetylase (PgdA/CDA1 family)
VTDVHHDRSDGLKEPHDSWTNRRMLARLLSPALIALTVLSLGLLSAMAPAHEARALAGYGVGDSSRFRHAAHVPSGVLRSLPVAGQSLLAGRAHAVPILMYHVVAAPPAGAPYPDLFVTPRQFAGEMRFLARHGYRAVTLSRLLAGWQGRATLPHKPVVLTFDDGYRSVATHAAQILRRHRWPGVLDLALTHLGPRRDLTARTVRRLIRDGWEVASHTMTHPDLTTIAGPQLWFQVHRSRTVLERDFRVPIDFFCYPSGEYSAATARSVRRAGYLGALTTRPGLADPKDGLYTLARVRVGLGESLGQFAASLRLGYAPL